ncbi:MAG: phosphoribulokinase/uridine kinase family protein [Treponematales bacterium]
MSMSGIEIRVARDGGEERIPCPFGAAAETVVSRFGPLPGPLAAVKVNNEILPLSARLRVNARLEPVLLGSQEGAAIYRRSLAFLLAATAKELFPSRGLYIGHSLGNGYYYTFSDEKKPEPEEIAALKQKMDSLAAADIPITLRYMAYHEALELFVKNGQTDTARLLGGRNDPKVLVNECKDFRDLYIAPLVGRTGLLTAFELMAYQDGFLLRFPHSGKGAFIDAFEDSPKIFAVYREYKKWGRIVGVHAAGGLNRLIADRQITEFIRIAEAFQEKKLAEIADSIYARRDSVRAVLIAGPSSSGKTTTAKRLSVQLKVLGIEPVAISLDDYYLGAERAPLDENGKPDLECLEALDVPLFNAQLLDLFAGREVTLPAFDFKAGRRREQGGRRVRLDKRSMLVIEGIHGLNDALTPQVPPETKFKVYVSALTQLNLDDHNRIPTSDNRLLRRMVRDYNFRGAGAHRWHFGQWNHLHSGRGWLVPFHGNFRHDLYCVVG